jgi:hypothetical protein
MTSAITTEDLRLDIHPRRGEHLNDHPVMVLAQHLVDSAGKLLPGVEALITVRDPKDLLTVTMTTADGPCSLLLAQRAVDSFLAHGDESPDIHHQVAAMSIKVQSLTTAFHELGRIVQAQSDQIGQLLTALAEEREEDEEQPISDLDGNVGGRPRDPGTSLG